MKIIFALKLFLSWGKNTNEKILKSFLKITDVKNPDDVVQFKQNFRRLEFFIHSDENLREIIIQFRNVQNLQRVQKSLHNFVRQNPMR